MKLSDADRIAPPNSERADLLETLSKHRGFLRLTVRGLSDAQAAQRSTVSDLCLGGLIKHAAFVEEGWAAFIVAGTAAKRGADPEAMQSHVNSFRMLESDTLAGLLAGYQETADRTDELIRSLPSLDVPHALAEAPWFPPGARWTARRVILHIIAETAQHAGHADILREAIDGQKTMG